MRKSSRHVIATLAVFAALALGGATALGVAPRVFDGPVPASDDPAGRFPAPPKGDRAVVWAVGDGADSGGENSAVARLVSSGDPTRFIYLGDVYDDGSAAEFATSYASLYGSLKGITLPTPGNHDWPAHAEGYDPYWAGVTGRRPPDHYAIRLAGWEIISLNSESPHDESSEQLKWLRGRLASGGNCRIAFWHRPRYSAGDHGDQGDLAPLWDALLGRARLVLGGHEHNMQRLREIDGITTLIAGAGGQRRYGVDDGDDRVAWSNVSDDGALRLELTPGRASYEFRSTDGATLHSGTAACSPPP